MKFLVVFTSQAASNSALGRETLCDRQARPTLLEMELLIDYQTPTCSSEWMTAQVLNVGVGVNLYILRIYHN